MGSKVTTTPALFLAFNLTFLILASACVHCSPPPPVPFPPPPYSPTTPPPVPFPPPPYSPTTPPPVPFPPPPYSPTTPPPQATCPTNALKLRACANLLNIIGIGIGPSQTRPCCSLLDGLVDLEAAVCLCTAIKANILGINLDVALDLGLILNACGRKVPPGYQCA